MKVILRSNIEQLGKIGQVVEVASGYARNYLIPKNLAYMANKGNLKRIEFDKKKADQVAAKDHVLKQNDRISIIPHIGGG